MAGQLLAFCLKNDLIAEDAEDPLVKEILLDGIASDTPQLLHKAFQTSMAFGKLHLCLLFGTPIIESSNQSWLKDYGLCPDLQATLAELYVMTRCPDRAIKLLQQCIDWPGTLNIEKGAYHEQIARCYRICGENKKEKHHIKRAKQVKSLPESSLVDVHGNGEDVYDSGEDDYDQSSNGFAGFHSHEQRTISGDFLVWLGDFASLDQVIEYVKSDSDDWEPASPLNAAFGFALLEGQGYGESELSYAWTKTAKKVKEILAPFAGISELPESAAKAASKSHLESCNSLVVFYDANRTYFVEVPFPAGSPLTYLGRFSYTQGRLVEVTTAAYPSSLRLERADSCLAERHFKQAEVFLRAQLDDNEQHQVTSSASTLLKLCLVLVATADDFYQFGQVSLAEQKFNQTIGLFSEFVNGGGWSTELGHSDDDDLSQFLYYCENYALRLEDSNQKVQAVEIYKTLLALLQNLYGAATDSQLERWQLAVDRCLN